MTSKVDDAWADLEKCIKAEVQARNVYASIECSANPDHDALATAQSVLQDACGAEEAARARYEDAVNNQDAELEQAFVTAIGLDKWQRLLYENWLPFQGNSHYSIAFDAAVSREVAAAQEFLSQLDL